MKAIFITLFIFLLAPLSTTAQNNPPMRQSTKDAFNLGNVNTNPNTSFLYGIAQEPGQVVGDAYLDTAWHKATVWFFSTAVRRADPKAIDSVSGMPIRIDLLNQLVEFRLEPDSVKGVDYSAIRSILYQGPEGDISLLNTMLYGVSPKEDPGFFQVLASGSVTLLKYTRLHVKAPTYHAALNSGSKDAVISKRKEYYLRLGNKTPEKIKLNKKKLLESLARYSSKLEAYAAQHQLDWGQEADVARLIGYANELGRE